jgi:ATP-binding cassette subfamily B protein
MKSERVEIPTNPFAFAWWSSRGNRGWAWGAITAVTIASGISLSGHYVIKELTNAAATVDLSNDETLNTLWFWTFAYPLVIFLGQSTWRVSGFCGMRWVTKTSATIYEELFAYLSHHSSAYFSDRFAGALSNKISNAASGVNDLQCKFLWEFLTLIFSSFGSVYLAYQAHPMLAAILFCWLFIFIGFNLLAVKKVKKYSYEYAESTSELKGKIVDSTTNIDVVHQSGQVQFEQRYVNNFVDKTRAAHLRTWTVFEWVLVCNGILLSIFNLLMLGTAVYFLQQEVLTVGYLVMIVTIIVGLQRQLFFIGHVISDSTRQYGQVQEGLEELLLPHDIVDTPEAQNVPVKKGAISFTDVTFAYTDQKVFDVFSLNIPAGQKLGFVGASGVGKSTLVSLLLRQFEVDEGAVSIDGVSIQELTLESLRKSIALVPQSTSMFHRTIFENIRYGRLDATEEEVEQAAKRAQAHEFILEFTDGYKTFVGERGVKLSGGQRQRIAIARAILKHAPILVLDEATSALDSESEVAIQQALEHLMEDKTVIAIAHRLSTLRAMDRIIVLDAGKIIEDGNHEELLSKEGTYHKLWTNQMHGFLQG